MDLGKSRFDEVSACLARMNLNGSKASRKQNPTLRRLRWAFHSKDKFAALTKELAYFVSRLRQLVPASENQARSMFKEDMHSICSTLLSQRVQEAATDTIQAKAAQDHVKLLHRQRILDCLWFRMLREKYDSLKPPNAETLAWVLDANAECLGWASFAAWLQGNYSSVYWICGKGRDDDHQPASD